MTAMEAIHRARPSRRTLAVVALALLPMAAAAAPLTNEEIGKLCAEADGPVDCGRKIEAVQLGRLPRLATRDGDTLKVSLYPGGTVSFVDAETTSGGRYYTLWDVLDPINTAVIFTIDDEESKFTLLQRANGRRIEVPAEPRLSPDRQRLVTADFCATRCVNELAVWRVSRDGIRKELAWKPAEAWADATASWTDADTLSIEYTIAGQTAAKTLDRKLDDARWQRIPPP